MSSKKTQMKLFERIKTIRLSWKLSQKEMAIELGIATSTYQYYERGERDIPSDVLIKLTTKGVKAEWLLTGEGSPYIIEAENTPESSEADPEVTDLLAMTRRIITSETGYAHSLKANIRSFHDAVETQTRLDKLEQRISEMEKDRSGNESGGCPPGTNPAPDIESEPGRRTGT